MERYARVTIEKKEIINLKTEAKILIISWLVLMPSIYIISSKNSAMVPTFGYASKIIEISKYPRVHTNIRRTIPIINMVSIFERMIFNAEFGVIKIR